MIAEKRKLFFLFLSKSRLVALHVQEAMQMAQDSMESSGLALRNAEARISELERLLAEARRSCRRSWATVKRS